MFDIGWGELVLIGIVALIAIGPKELPGVLRALGQWMSKIRRMASDFQGQFQEAMREAEMEDIRKQVEQIGDTTRDFAHFDPLADRSHDKPAPAPGNNAASASEETTPVAAPAGAAASAPAASPEPDIAAPPKPTGEGRP